MNDTPSSASAASLSSSTSRRDFIKTGSAAAGASVLAGVSLPHVHGAGDESIRAVIVGCGGRGTGAVSNCLTLQNAPTRLVAMADVSENRLKSSFEALSGKHPDRMSVSEDQKFIGFDAYKHAIDQLRPNSADVVILTTPPAFRWVHYKYAIEKGVNVFMEKPVCVDGPSGRRLLELNEEAKKKGLKVGVGLMCRHCQRRKELFEKIQGGLIGDLMMMRAYRMMGPVASCFTTPRDPAIYPNELLWQIERFHSFLWLSGGAFSDFNIHNIDEACWMKDDWPVEAIASGGRTERGDYIDQNFDHYNVEYTFKDGAKLFFQGRNAVGTYNEFATYVHGTTGWAIVSAARHTPSKAMAFKGQTMDRKNLLWRAEQPELNPYDLEWEDLTDAIMNNKPYNEV
ncbi:MAG: Gfo/Idh/MocA family oxidoreductase, partial [Verrucomicrobiales bacterium]|nr:Gfo/Idh/MocA family oxidoreductase [Verrucomicrobiales bacterium]